MKHNEQSEKSGSASYENQFGLGGEAPPLEYIFTFVREHNLLRKKFRALKKLTQDDIGYLTKAAWIAHNRQLSPGEYLQTIFSKHQRMPIPGIPSPCQLCSKFTVDVVDAEVIKKIEVPPEIRARELAKKNYGLRLDRDTDYHTFIAEFKRHKIEDVEDAEFKSSYCRMRDVQTTGEPKEFITEIEGKIAILRDHEGGNE